MSQAEAKIIATTSKPAYSGQEEVRVLGVALPPPYTVPFRLPYNTVQVVIRNPEGLVMWLKGAGVSESNGAFTSALIAGGSEEWITGTYEVSVKSVRTSFEYKATETETSPRVNTERSTTLPPPDVMSKQVEIFQSRSLYDLYYDFGYLKWQAARDDEFRSLAPRVVYDRLTAARLDPNDMVIGTRRWLRRYWKTLVDTTCEWAQSQAGTITVAMTGSLAIALAVVIPPPANISVAPFAAAAAAIMIQSGVRTICEDPPAEPPAPPLTGIDTEP